MQSLTDQVAVITERGQGIGRAVAQVLASEGARVAIADVETDRAKATAAELRAAGHAATAYAVDVVDLASLTAMSDAVLAEWGRIDILAAVAGIYPSSPIGELPAASGIASWTSTSRARSSRCRPACRRCAGAGTAGSC